MRARTLALITIGIWSTGVVAGKLLAECSAVLGLFLTTSCALIFLLMLQRLAPARRRIVFRPSYMLYGANGSLIYYLCFLQAFRVLPSTAVAGLLNYTWPVFTVVFTDLLFSRLSKSRRQRAFEALGIICGFAAVALLYLGGETGALSHISLVGLLWGLGAGASYGLFGAFSSTVQEDDRFSFLFNSVFVSWIGALVLCLATGQFWNITSLTLLQLAYGAYNGFVIDGLGELCWTRANQHAADEKTSIAKIAALMFLLPVLSIGLAGFVLREYEMFQISFLSSLGLIVLGAVLCDKAQKPG